MKEFKYLDYMLAKNGENQGHTKNITRRSNVVIKQMLSIGEKRFGVQSARTIILFDYQVVKTLTCEVEI